jgi:cytochrome c-type biogenesis protein CcmH
VRAPRALAALVAAAACAALAAPAAAQEPQTSLPDIEDEVMCPVCGVSLELATEAPQAEQMRGFIRDRIDDGQSKEEIKDALVAEYGPEVLATPDDRGFDLSAWIVPALGLLAAAIALALGARRLARRGRRPGEEPAPLSEEERARLERDLSTYER